jgi:eukaryotic-like serine/threonine-protein kinase
MSFNRQPNNEDSSIAVNKSGDSEIDSLVGKRVGIYRLEKRIGKGGMGAVYLASRDDGEFRQQVAVKLIKRGMDTDFVLNRFRHERQILASLEHPFIARLLDGGTTDDGLPFFVMDFIKGEPLIEYADKNDLDLRERLELFRRVCEAVGFAHQKQIVHRDLKPSNILVTQNGMPKLLDFGIAKLLNPEAADETLMPTQTQMRLMTAEYAAPEQIRGEAITPATDVYSLGVLLYELVTGARPYKFPSRAPHDIARVICEETPLSLGFHPLLKIQTNLNQSKDDLENIILKSLQKKPSDRYASVRDFSDDIARFLKGQKVKAQSSDPKGKTVQPNQLSNTPTGSRSIAVLPLKFFGADDDADTSDRFLSLGLADALIAKLSSVRRFVLRPTSSVLRYGEMGVDSFAAGADLGVEFIVDGHIRKVGEVIRVSVQLLNIAERTTVWAERFNEKSADVLELEDRISKRVAESLIPHLTADERENLERRGTKNADAYEAYLRGRFYWNKFTPEALPKALDSFQTAVALDANYALAYVGIADFYIWANIYGMIPSAEATPLAEAAARRAIELNPEQSEAYATLGLVKQNKREWDESIELYKKSLELSPNYVHAHEWNAATLIGMGNIEAGVAEIKRAEQIDPLSLRTKTLTAWTLYQARRYDETIERGRQIIDLDRNYPQGYSQAGFGLLMAGRAEEALVNFQKFDAMITQSALAKYQLCFALVAVNRAGEARKILEELKSLAANGYVKPYFLAMAHTALGEIDAAFEYFEQAFNDNDPWLLWFGTEPMLDPLRDDDRYFDLLRRMKNPIVEQQLRKII